MKVSYKQIENLMMQIAIVLTVLSFSPNGEVANVCGLVMFLFWGAVVLFKILGRELRIDTFAKTMAVIYVVWTILTKIFYSTGLFLSGGLGVVTFFPYCIIFYIIGINFKGDEKEFSGILTAFFIGQTLLTITLLPYLDAISEQRYAFLAKNQTGQMLGTGVLFGFFVLFRQYKSIILKVVVLLFSSISLMSLLIVGSRTPLIGIAVVAIVSFVLKKNKSKGDYAFLAAIVAAIGVTVYFLGGIDYIVELFELTDTGDGIDINTITSGRFTLYAQALGEFFQNPLLGMGAWAYVDNFVINILRCGGLLLAILILPVSYRKLYTTYKKANILQKATKEDLVATSSKMLIIFYFVVSLMEGYPPMGPSTSVFFLWILLGIISGKECLENATE